MFDCLFYRNEMPKLPIFNSLPPSSTSNRNMPITTYNEPECDDISITETRLE